MFANEADVLAWLEGALLKTFGRPRQNELWFGDDAAEIVAHHNVVSADVCVAGVHLDTERFGTRALGWKAVATAISDLAGMGVEPRAMVATLMVPERLDAKDVLSGMLDSGRAHNCPLVGGDLSAGPVLAVSVTVIGQPWPAARAVHRSGAQVGDAIVVTGPLGAAAAGLRLVDDDDISKRCRHAQAWPRARLVEGRLAALCGATAMMDLSDGLATDLARLCDRSKVGFALGSLPVSPGATLDEALGGGEDYELVLTLANPATFVERCVTLGLRVPSVIGVITGDVNDRTVGGVPLAIEGFVHRFENRA